MAIDTVLSFDRTTAANNVDVDGVGIQGSSPISSGNDAIQSFMKLIGAALTRRVAKSGSATAAKTDHAQFWDFTAAATLGLTAAATLTDGWCLYVKATGGSVTIDPNSAELVDGVATVVIPVGHSALINCTGTAFFTTCNTNAAPVDVVRRQGALTPHENLIVKRITAATVDIDADGIVLFDANGVAKRFPSVNLTVDITASGVNGLDTGSEANSTWYFIHGVGKADGTLAGLLSLSATTPTMPATYTFKGLLGALYNDGSGNIISFIQRGNLVSRSAVAVLSAASATTYSAISLTTAVPNLATSAIGYGGPNTTSGTSSVTLAIAPEGSTTTATYGEVFIQDNEGSTNAALTPFECLIETAQQIKYYVAGTNARANMSIAGWRF